jgi:hypothetical protein
MPLGRNFHDWVSRVLGLAAPVASLLPAEPSAGSSANPQRTQPSLTSQANSRPGSAATTWLRVSHVRSAFWLRPVNHAPTCGPSPSSHQHARQTGLHSPIRVTSETMAYVASGSRAMRIESAYSRSVTPPESRHPDNPATDPISTGLAAHNWK